MQCKKIFLKNLHSLLDPLQERRKAVSDEVARDILLAGNEKARAFARSTMEDVRRLVKIF